MSGASGGGGGGYGGAGMSMVGSILSAYAQQQAGRMESAGYNYSANAALAQGVAQQQEEDYRAGLLTQQAGQERASSQAQAVNSRLQTDYTISRARAVAAASGAGATDPTVVNVEKQIRGVGEYDALTALFNGEERARGLEDQAALAKYQGTEALQAGQIKQAGYNYQGAVAKSTANMKAISTVVSGLGSMYSKYG